MNEPNVPLSGAGAIPQDRTLEVLCHLLGLAALTGIPFANVLAPLGLWLWKRESNPAVDAHGREAINFQLTAAIALVLSGFLCLILVGFILLPVVLIGQIAFTIIGSLRAGRGELYRYPLAIRFFN